MNSIKKLLCLIVIGLPMIVSAQGIRFEEGVRWSDVLQKAKKENKFIFVDCYATWCMPCKYMDKNIYSNDTVGRYFNENFISIKVQMDTSKTDNAYVKGWYADAGMLKSKYNVAAFPTYLFFSPQGAVVHREVGAGFRPISFVSLGMDALNSEKQYYTLLEKYRRNELKTASLKVLALKVKQTEGSELANKIANDYINHLPLDELLKKENIQFMYSFTKTSKDRGFSVFKDYGKRISAIDKSISEEVCKGLVLRIINDEEIKPYNFSKNGKADWKKIKDNLKKYGTLGDEAFIKFKPGIIFRTEIEPELKIDPDWKHIRSLIQKQNLGKHAEFVVGSTVVYYFNSLADYQTENTCRNLVAAQTYYADSFPTFLNASTLNTWAWRLFEISNNKDELSKALEWSKKANELKPDSPQLMDTYANLCYKLGNTIEAVQWQKRAVEMIKTKGYEDITIQRALEKMLRGEKTWPDN